MTTATDRAAEIAAIRAEHKDLILQAKRYLVGNLDEARNQRASALVALARELRESNIDAFPTQVAK